MANDLSSMEQETHFNITGDNRDVVHVFSDDSMWIRRLDKLATGTSCGAGKKYELNIDQLVIRKGKRSVSDASRLASAERMRRLNQKHTVAVEK